MDILVTSDSEEASYSSEWNSGEKLSNLSFSLATVASHFYALARVSLLLPKPAVLFRVTLPLKTQLPQPCSAVHLPTPPSTGKLTQTCPTTLTSPSPVLLHYRCTDTKVSSLFGFH